MKKSKRDEFLKWHAENKEGCQGMFDLSKQIVEYSEKEVEVVCVH